MVLVAPCIRCRTVFASDPQTVPSVWVNLATQSPLRPDASAIEPGEPGTAREPLCEACAPIIRAAAGRRLPLLALFPHARVDRITRPE